MFEVEEREEKRVVSLQPVKKLCERDKLRETSGSCINSKELTTIWVS